MTQSDTARTFAELHRPGAPLILYNAWDAGSAKAIAKAGAAAIATGSWSLAHAQAERIAVLCKAARATGVPVFINARCDVFFQGSKPDTHADLMPEAIERAKAYAQAGADGLFVPGLITPDLISDICSATSLPVNIMQTGKAPDHRTLADLGVARISHGPAPYLTAMAGVTEAAKTALTV